MVHTVTIISLSSGILGEAYVKHELDIGLKRLERYGLNVKFSKHSLRGEAFLKAHPEARAQDLLDAFTDPDTDMILCAIGGDDTYRLSPYLFENNELQKAASQKIFLGFSDTTINHLMLHKVGIKSFYGQAFLPDICELDDEMLPYTKHYFEELLTTGTIQEIRPSDIWYQSRTDFSPSAIGQTMPHAPDRGFVLLQGRSKFCGKILGGCIDSLYDLFNHDRYGDSVEISNKYGLFPPADDWEGKILLLETSEEQPSPEKYGAMLYALKRTGIFHRISGILVGKPMDETYYNAYQALLLSVVDDPSLPIVYNINVGHATPRCIIPFGVTATVDTDAQTISFAAE